MTSMEGNEGLRNGLIAGPTTWPTRTAREREDSAGSGLRRVRTWGVWDRELAEEGTSTRRNPVDAQQQECLSEEEQTFTRNISTRRYVKYYEKSVLNYNAEGIIGPGVLVAACTSASILARKTLIRDLFLIVTFSLLFGGGLHLFDVEVDKNDMDKLVNLVKDFQSLCTFLLGFFIMTCLTRWWAIRNDCIGLLWGSCDDLALIIGSYFGRDTPEDKKVRDQVLRWSLLSYELVYKQAQAKEELSDLKDRKILTQEEHELLLKECSKPQVVWGWMCSYFAHLAYGDPAQGGSRLPYPVTVLPQLHEICRHARGSIGALFAYTDTQVPFRYVHFLALIIWMHNFFQAVMSACVISNSLPNAEHEIQVTSICIEVIFLVFHPLIYFGLLHLGVGMLNPMRGKRDIDFPRGAWSFYMWAEIKSIFSANSEPKGPPWGSPAVWRSTPTGGVEKRPYETGDLTVMQAPLEESSATW